MLKMYNAEVLSKFPVVQHFHFGALFCWEAHPDLARKPTGMNVRASPPRPSGNPPSKVSEIGTKAPWITSGSGPPPAGRTPAFATGVPRAAWASSGSGGPLPGAYTATPAPWALDRPDPNDPTDKTYPPRR